MSKQFYKHTEFRAAALAMIDVMNDICDSYVAQGFVLTVRQLYYQLVARGHIENTERSYKRTTNLVNDARLAGLMDWDAIEDRTRAFIKRSRWETPNDALASVAQQFHMDLWTGQEHRVYVIVEKEALAGVLEGVCNAHDVPLLAARGYPSGTVLREFAQIDLEQCGGEEQTPVILHFGDHDPSGIDMSRDLEERIELFNECGQAVLFRRLALNWDQIEEQKPPPNPAKVTDSRFADYARKYGMESWELDALTPTYLTDLVRKHVMEYIDVPVWNRRIKSIKHIRTRLEKTAKEFK
jgi:hypothetical protein